MEKLNMDEQMENVSGGAIEAQVTLTGDDALAYLDSNLYKNRKNPAPGGATAGIWGSKGANAGQQNPWGQNHAGGWAKPNQNKK